MEDLSTVLCLRNLEVYLQQSNNCLTAGVSDLLAVFLAMLQSFQIIVIHLVSWLQPTNRNDGQSYENKVQIVISHNFYLKPCNRPPKSD